MAADSRNRRREPSPESPHKCPRTDDLYDSPSPPQTDDKFKSPADTNYKVCGICLSETFSDDYRVSRGCLDSCDHFFCFVCIMVWAKVDSKCPLCKRRFSTIRRPPKPPVFPSERIVRVPVRNQVYDADGNATTGPLDLYSDCKCSVCQGSEDDSLLLLCDLCDAASHTYCVGLGATVPDGDWFCPDCTLLKAEQAKNDQIDFAEQAENDWMDSDAGNSSNSRSSCGSTSNHVSIFDIVREPFGWRGDYATGLYSSNRDSSAARMQVRIAQAQTEPDVRTLQRCRNVNSCIQGLRGNSGLLDNGISQSCVQDAQRQNTGNAQRQIGQDHLQLLRDNWNSIQSGSLGFTQNISHSGGKSLAKVDIGDHSHQPSSTSNSCQVSKSEKVSSGATTDSCVTDKAWKMMHIAKSLEQRKGTLRQASKVLLPKISEVWPVNVVSTSQGKQNHCENLQETSIMRANNIRQTKNKHQEQIQDGCRDITDSLHIRPALQYGLQVGSNVNSSDKIRSKVPYAGTSVCSMSGCSSSTVQPASAQTVQNSKHKNLELHATFCCKADPLEQNTAVNRSPANVRAKESCDAKSEIQSLVKLNLKLLSNKKKLEVDAFKCVARLATHSILAACGLERPKHGIYRFQSCVCHHTNDGPLIRRSTLMPNSCRECFYIFVKDVVNSIMLDRIGTKG